MLVDRMQILVVMTTLVTANRNNYNCVSSKEIVSYNYVPRFQNEVLSSSVGGLCLELDVAVAALWRQQESAASCLSFGYIFSLLFFKYSSVLLHFLSEFTESLITFVI